MAETDITLEELEEELGKVSADLYQLSPRVTALIEKMKALGVDVKESQSKLQRTQENVEATVAADKKLQDRVEALEQARIAGSRILDEIQGRLDGGQGGEDWTVEKIRTTVRNSAFTGNLIKGTIGLIGVGTVTTAVLAVLGLGRSPEQEFTYLTSHQALQAEVDKIQSTIDKWETTVEKAKEKLVFEISE